MEAGLAADKNVGFHMLLIKYVYVIKHYCIWSLVSLSVKITNESKD